jgi:GMP synthase-like glutamine amidotransferase
MEPRVLVIQFRDSHASRAGEQAALQRAAGTTAKLVFLSALDEGVAWDEPRHLLRDFSGLILGGSGDFDFDGGRSPHDPARTQSQVFLARLRLVCDYVLNNDFPTFGICYGHQLLGAHHGAVVFHDETQRKTRSHEVQRVDLSEPAPILATLPQRFAAHYGHKDALGRVPPGAVVLLEGGEQCRVSALQYGRRVVSTQFHPELSHADMIERISRSPGYLPEGVAAHELFTPDDRSGTLLSNFFTTLVRE